MASRLLQVWQLAPPTSRTACTTAASAFFAYDNSGYRLARYDGPVGRAEGDDAEPAEPPHSPREPGRSPKHSPPSTSLTVAPQSRAPVGAALALGAGDALGGPVGERSYV